MNIQLPSYSVEQTPTEVSAQGVLMSIQDYLTGVHQI